MLLTEMNIVPGRVRSSRARWLVPAIALHLAGAASVGASGAENGFVIRSGSAVLRSTHDREPGRIPVVLIHGMLGTPGLWSAMIEQLSAEPPIAERFQFLTFGYDSLQSIPVSARELREALAEARRRFDPEGRDASFDRIVLVGHSLGGLVAKAAAAAGDETMGPASPRAGRLIFVATPHRGTPVDQGVVRSVGARLARALSPALAAGAPTSVDQLTPDHTLLLDLEQARAAARVPFHSIIAALGDPATAGATDGLVPVASARLAGARSELVVHGAHLCHQDQDVIQEVHRVLGEHAAEAARFARQGAANAPRAESGGALSTRPVRLSGGLATSSDRTVRSRPTHPARLTRGPSPGTERPETNQ